MKKIFHFTILVLITSCSKEKNLQKLSDEFSGEWEIEKFIGYPNNQDYPSGNGEIIVLRKNGSFERKQNNIVVYLGQFFLELEKDCGASKKETFFSTNDSSYSWNSKIRIDNYKLFLQTSTCVADGGVSIYRKLKDVD